MGVGLVGRARLEERDSVGTDGGDVLSWNTASFEM